MDHTKETPWFSTLPIAMGNHLRDFSDQDTGKYINIMTYSR